MQEYLFHALSRSGAPVAGSFRAFEDDAAAIRHGLSPAFPSGCDIWRRSRLVGRVCGPAEVRTSGAAVEASTARAA